MVKIVSNRQPKARRITILIDDDILKKLREIQGKQIRDTSNNVSLSQVINECLRKGLKGK